MTWSGKQALLDEFRPQFHNQDLLDESMRSYLTKSRVYDDDRCRKWLLRDLERDQELATIADPEDYALGPSRYELNGCFHCSGRGMVRLDVDTRHPDFGKVKPCPACAGRAGDRSTHCPTCAQFSEQNRAENLTQPVTESGAPAWRNRCMKCGQYEDQPAGEKCRHPKWHLPNWKTIQPADDGKRRDYVAELARQMKVS